MIAAHTATCNCDQPTARIILNHHHQPLLSASFVAAITVVAWSSFIQVESKILEKIGAKSVGSREAFRQKTTPVFYAAVLLFGVSVTSFVTAFILIGYIKPCTQIPQLPNPQTQNPNPKPKTLSPKPQAPTPTSSHSHTYPGVQTADSVQIDFIRPYLLGQLPPGSKGPVNRLANRTYTRACTRARIYTPTLPSAYWVEISIESDFFPYTLPMSIAGAIIFFFALAASVYVAVRARRSGWFSGKL